jgi:dihydroorotate dehydrogenase (NAD+) catalytic subunit
VTIATTVGDVSLASAVLVASGTAGYGDELAGYGDLAQLGAVVTKSLAAFAWAGNPAPRVVPAGSGLLNSVGLAGPGVSAWRTGHLPALLARGAMVVGSIWGRSADEFAAAAAALRGANIVAVEVNASCPNVEDRSRMFAHSPEATAAVVTAAAAAGVPRWVKLSPNTPDLVAVAGAAVAAGADALVLTNTLLGMRISHVTDQPALGAGGGGLSGPPLLPVALRAVYECRAALPTVPIVGVGGVSCGADVIEMVMAGANAVEVGTAIFADPRAPWRIQRDVVTWLRHSPFSSLRELQGRAHGR